MKLSHLISEDTSKLASVYLKGVKQTGVLKAFKGNFALPRGLEEEILEETVRLIKAGFIGKRNLWFQFDQVRSSLKLNGDVSSLYSATSSIERLTGEHVPASVKELKDAAVAMQALIESNTAMYGGIYKCKQVLDELAGLALKRYPLNTNERDVDEQISFAATMTLKGLGVWTHYQQALADGKTL